jgi:hypothetical protein
VLFVAFAMLHGTCDEVVAICTSVTRTAPSDTGRMGRVYATRRVCMFAYEHLHMLRIFNAGLSVTYHATIVG